MVVLGRLRVHISFAFFSLPFNVLFSKGLLSPTLEVARDREKEQPWDPANDPVYETVQANHFNKRGISLA